MKPSADELKQALAEAERLRAINADQHHLAKAMLYQHERLQHLEEVRRLAERLMNFGQDEHDHALLVKALGAARHAEEQAGREEGDFGLA